MEEELIILLQGRVGKINEIEYLRFLNKQLLKIIEKLLGTKILKD